MIYAVLYFTTLKLVAQTSPLLFFPMLVRYTRATALLRRAQEFFPHSFLPPQAKLHTWPSLIHDGCVLQARHTHTYSDTKDALKTGIRNVKENIKEGVK